MTHRLHWLDWIRFLAALVVVLGHARNDHWVAWNEIEASSRNVAALGFFALTRLGEEAVLVFFVLSGYLVGGKLIERTQRGTFDTKSYAIDRFSRIYVPLVPAILLTVAAGWLLHTPPNWSQVIGNLLSVQRIACEPLTVNAPLWSLSYEVWFYVLGGALAALLARQSQSNLLAAIIAAAALSVYVKLSAAFLFCWIFGALAYDVAHELKHWTWSILGICMALVGTVMCQMAKGTESTALQSYATPLFTREAAALILSGGIALALPWITTLRPNHLLVARFETLGETLANGSYTLYLTHYPILKLWEHYSGHRETIIDVRTVALWSAKVTLCLLVAMIMYLGFEMHTARIRRLLKTWFVPASVAIERP